jgi:hypothetical protein
MRGGFFIQKQSPRSLESGLSGVNRLLDLHGLMLCEFPEELPVLFCKDQDVN